MSEKIANDKNTGGTRPHRARLEMRRRPGGRGPKDLRRGFIDAEAAKEREHSRFFGSFDEIREICPDCIRDWSFVY